MKLHIMSDLHRDIEGDMTIRTLAADMVVLAGDIDGGFDSVRWAVKTFTQPTLFVLGNHEIVAGDKEKLEKFRDLTKGTDVTILENDILEKNGVRFLGCSLWAPANRRMSDTMNNSIKWLRESLSQPYNGKTVVVTHYSPLHESLDPETAADVDLANKISVDLRSLIERSDIVLWIHGHIHVKQDYICGKTRVVCNPRGYADMVEPMFDPNFMVEV